jgi:hypothetical protein
MKTLISILMYSLVASMVLPGQTLPIDIEIYKDFTSAHEDMPPSELFQLYPSDVFKEFVPYYNLGTVLFLDEISKKYNLTTNEKRLLTDHGFMVTERLQAGSYFIQFVEIYKKDLPVFVSTDAILHAFHLSYDELLKQVEICYLIPELRKLLGNAHSRLNSLNEKYGQVKEMKPMLYDVDLYLTVARKLLGDPAQVFYPDNETPVSEYLARVNSEQMKSVCFFSDSMIREIDFSQFKPRGHYEYTYDTDNELPGYFRTMMWLGRMELYLDHPDYYEKAEVKVTVQRQIMDAYLLHYLFTTGGNEEIWEEMEDIISFFVGEQDNVSPKGMNQLLLECEIKVATELLDESKIDRFLDDLREKPFAGQHILSQVFKGNCNGTSRPLPSSFMPFGQRFVIDSYVTGQVVYDRIIYEEGNICRLVPSTLDIMFALGNDAALQLLIPELNTWHYSDNLAGLRFLIDQSGEEFWESSLYNLWLHVIESLNPDPKNEDIPAFMKTAAWGLEKLNTQLASWTELRHDNILYAKQSYTFVGSCSHPEGYVEPNPEFFGRMKRLAEIAEKKFKTINEQISWHSMNPVTYFKKMYEICNTLQNIAYKELSAEELSDAECQFLDDISFFGFTGSAGVPDGWYTQLIFNGVDPCEANIVVADYHTTPTDCIETPLGWVSHAGTGKPDMAVVVAPLANGQLCAFAGPVASYHEYRTSDYLRLTDSEWQKKYLDLSFRPDWVYHYLADDKGETTNTELKFFTDLDELGRALNMQITSFRDNKLQTGESISIVPNPVYRSAMITIKIPESSHGATAKLSVCDLNGSMIRTLINGPLPSGYFLTEWDCNNESGNKVTPGAYFIIWEHGDSRIVEKLLVIK